MLRFGGCVNSLQDNQFNLQSVFGFRAIYNPRGDWVYQGIFVDVCFRDEETKW